MRHVFVSFVLIALGGCAPHRLAHTDVGPPGADGGTGTDAAIAPRDTGNPPGEDAAMVGTDAFVPPGSDAGRDAAVAPPIDAGRDAGSSGCTPLPTTTTVLHGTIAAGATFNRPTTDCGVLSTVATDVYYATHVFCNTGAPRSYEFALDEAATGGAHDPFVVVYTGMGDVSTLSCLASDDDSGVATLAALATASVPTGTITVVATTFSNGTTGDYQLTITPM